MIISTRRAAATLALAVLTAGGCNSGATTGGKNNGGGGSGGGGSGGTNTAKGACDNPQLEILFAPMYSAYDGVHTFKLPAVVNSIMAGAVSWSASDPSLVDMVPDPATGGTMMTMRKAGTVKIIASAGGLCGVSTLTIAQASPDDWMVGSKRYNEGIVLRGLPRGGGGAPDGGENPREAACTNCHGDTATMGLFKTVAHTPQQTGGFSDEDLVNIFTKGMVPVGGYFDEAVVSYRAWQSFHHWDMTPEQAKGVIVYLRQLTPQSQTGMRGDFGGARGDGGRRGGGDGGFRRGDGGGMNPAGEDASSSTD
jgi:hypothetical protein